MPDMDDLTQMKIDAYTDNTPSEKLPEEFEDDEFIEESFDDEDDDPMA